LNGQRGAKMAKKFKFNIIKTVITIACLIILGTIGREVFFRHFFNERHTIIPNVVNLHEKDAVKYLKDAGLNVKIINSKNINIKAGKIHFLKFFTFIKISSYTINNLKD